MHENDDFIPDMSGLDPTEPKFIVLFDRETQTWMHAWVDSIGNILASTPVSQARAVISEMIQTISLDGHRAPSIVLKAVIVDEGGQEVETILLRPHPVDEHSQRNPRAWKADAVGFFIAVTSQLLRYNVGRSKSKAKKGEIAHLMEHLASDPLMRIMVTIVSVWLLNFGKPFTVDRKRLAGLLLLIPLEFLDVRFERVPRLKRVLVHQDTEEDSVQTAQSQTKPAFKMPGVK